MQTTHVRYRWRHHAEAYAQHLERTLPGHTAHVVPDPYDPFYYSAVLVTTPTGHSAYATRTHGWRYRKPTA